MVRQAGKWLCADDVIDAGVDQFQHFPGQEPSLTGLIAERYNVFCHISDLFDAGRRFKMNALFQLISRGSPELFQDIDTKVRDHSGFLFRTEVFALEILVVEAVEKEVHQVGYYGLRAFCFKQFHQMIVGGRHEFYKNLSYYADFWLFLICDRKAVKILYDLAAHLFELAVRRFAGNEFAAAVFPLLKECIRLARFFFIRSHTVQAAHKDIAEYESEHCTFDHLVTEREARIALKAAQIQGDDRDIWNAGFLERPADKSDVIGSTAPAAGLCHDHGCAA